MAKSDEIVIPDEARQDRESFEVLRVWVTQQGQLVSLRADAWDDPAAWGIVLADVARHSATAFEQMKILDAASALQRLRDGLEVEFLSPTDNPSGELYSDG